MFLMMKGTINKNSCFVLMIVFSSFLSCTDANLDAEMAIQESVVSLPYYDAPDFTPIWNSDSEDTLHRVSDFLFIDQNGKTISEKTTEGKIYLVNFFFSTCGSICPKMMRNMEKVQNSFAENDEVIFISHTVMPWIDSVETLKKYSTNFNVVDSKWFFVTGQKSEIYNLARTSYFVEEEPGFTKDSTEFLHTEHFVLIDKNRHLRGIYNGTVELEMERAIEDIELLLTEN